MKLEDLKVGQYVRTKEGYIAKFLHYGYNQGINGKSCLFDTQIRNINNSIYEEDNFLFDSELKKHIIKASFNIIDILEVGDYVNGHSVKSIQRDVKRIDIGEDENYVWLLNEHIKSIVTHQQMEQISYKLGE